MSRRWDPDHLRLVVEHFHDLQGLKSTAVGASLAGVFGVWLVAGPASWSDENWGLTALFLAAFGLMVLPIHWLERYYERRFGRVRSARQGWTSREMTWPLLGALSATLGREMGFGFVPYFCCVGGYYLWLSVRGAPHRWHCLIGTASGLIAALLTAASPDPVDLRITATGFSLIGCAMVAIGLVDHSLLSAVMRHPPSSDDVNQRAIDASRSH